MREDPQRPVFQCSICTLQFLERPNYSLREYYRERYRAEHDCVVGEKLTPEERFKLVRPLQEVRAYLFKRVIPKGATVLEVGCSSGYFLDSIRKDYTVFGNEWNPEDAAYVRDVGSIPCDEADLKDAFPGKLFTCIAAFHVLEHQPDPIAWLETAKSRLIGGGWIYLEVPNLDDALLSIYNLESFRNFFYREPHLLYFNMQSLGMLFGAVGLEGRITQKQDYGLWNHINWLMTNKPMPDAQAAQFPFLPVPEQHPASHVINRHFYEMDRMYRTRLDILKACNALIGVGRKYEI